MLPAKQLFLLATLLASHVATATPVLDLSPLKRQEPQHQRLQPARAVDFAPRDRPTVIDVLHYGLDISFDPRAGSISGSADIRIKSLSKDLQSVVLDADSMVISAVTSVDGTPLAFHYASPLLTITLAQPVDLGTEVAVRVHYTASRPQSLHLSKADYSNPHRSTQAYTFTEPEGSQEWFPCHDRPSDKATASLTVHSPPGFRVLTNGIRTEEVLGDNEWLQKYEVTDPIATYLISLYTAEGLMPTRNGEYHGKRLVLWAPEDIETAAWRDTIKTSAMMRSFSAFTGVDYPFPVYQQSVAQAWRGSMEHQGATTLGGWVIRGDGSGTSTIAHELAHQWFGDLVTCRSWGELWLNEGFASYLPLVYFADMNQGVDALSQLDDWRDGYFTAARYGVHALSEAQPNYGDLFDAHAYSKGALVIHLLRAEAKRRGIQIPYGQAGEEALTTALRLYLQRKAYGTVAATDLESALSEVTGQSWHEFFDQWIRSPGHPILNIESQWADGILQVKIKQSQVSNPQKKWRSFAMPLRLQLIQTNGLVSYATLDLYEAEQSFNLPLATAPAALSADPSWELPAEISVAQSPAAWEAVLQYAPEATSRMSAARALAKESKLSKSAETLLLAEKDSYVLTDALEKLAGTPTQRPLVERLWQELKARSAQPPIYIVGALARAEAWLMETRTEAPTAAEFSTWTSDYTAEESVSTERRAQLLKMMARYNLEATQDFAWQRLQESRWVDKDRYYLLDVISRKPTTRTDQAIAEGLLEISEIYLGQTLQLLIDAKYQNAKLIPKLVASVSAQRQTHLRQKLLELLQLQKEWHGCASEPCRASTHEVF